MSALLNIYGNGSDSIAIAILWKLCQQAFADDRQGLLWVSSSCSCCCCCSSSSSFSSCCCYCCSGGGCRCCCGFAILPNSLH